jgi:hypothetical protein
MSEGGEARNHEADDHADDIEMAFTRGYRQGRIDALDAVRRCPQGEDHDDGLWSGDWEYGDLQREVAELRAKVARLSAPERNTEKLVEALRKLRRGVAYAEPPVDRVALIAQMDRLLAEFFSTTKEQ